MPERIFGVAYQKTKETTDYSEWIKESISLSVDIIRLLGKERNIFDRYEELSTSRVDALLENTYKQGFNDGIELLKSLLYEGKI